MRNEKSINKELCGVVESVEEANMQGYYRDCYYYQDGDSKKYVLIPKEEIKTVVASLYKDDKLFEIEEILNSKKFLDAVDPDKSVSISERYPSNYYIKLVMAGLKNKKSLSNMIRLLLVKPINNTLDEIKGTSHSNEDKIKRALFHLDNIKKKIESEENTKNSYSLGYYYNVDKEMVDIIPKAIEFQIKEELKKHNISDEDIDKLFDLTYIDSSFYYDKDMNESLWGDLFSILITQEDGKFYLVGKVRFNLFLKKLEEYAENVDESELGPAVNSKFLRDIPKSILDLDFVNVDGDYEGETAFLTGDVELFRFPMEVNENGEVLINNIPVKDPKFIEKLISTDMKKTSKERDLDALMKYLDEDLDKAHKIVQHVQYSKFMPKFKKWLYDILKSSVTGSQVVTYTYPTDLALIVKYLKNKDITKEIVLSMKGVHLK